MRISLLALLAVCLSGWFSQSNASTCDCAPNYMISISDAIVCNYIPIMQTMWLGDPCPHIQLAPGSCTSYFNCEFGCLCQMQDWTTIVRWNFPRGADWYGPSPKIVIDLLNTGRPWSAVGCEFYALYQRLDDGSRGDTICADAVDYVDPGEGDEGAVYYVDPDVKYDNSTVIDLRSIMQRIRDQRARGERPQDVTVSVVGQ